MTAPEGDAGLVGTGAGAWIGALGRTGECEDARRDGGLEEAIEGC